MPRQPVQLAAQTECLVAAGAFHGGTQPRRNGRFRRQQKLAIEHHARRAARITGRDGMRTDAAVHPDGQRKLAAQTLQENETGFFAHRAARFLTFGDQSIRTQLHRGRRFVHMQHFEKQLDASRDARLRKTKPDSGLVTPVRITVRALAGSSARIWRVTGSEASNLTQKSPCARPRDPLDRGASCLRSAVSFQIQIRPRREFGHGRDGWRRSRSPCPGDPEDWRPEFRTGRD